VTEGNRINFLDQPNEFCTPGRIFRGQSRLCLGPDEYCQSTAVGFSANNSGQKVARFVISM